MAYLDILHYNITLLIFYGVHRPHTIEKGPKAISLVPSMNVLGKNILFLQANLQSFWGY